MKLDWKKRKKLNQNGQSAIEFIVVVLVILFFLLFFLSLSILMITSDYMEYATFMSARTYKSMFGSQQTQENNARTVFNQYADRVKGIARNFDLQFVPGDERGDQGAGVKVSYDIDLFYMPPLYLPEGAPGSVIRLSTESRLGRESTGQECFDFFKRLIRQLGVQMSDTYIGMMDDNAC